MGQQCQKVSTSVIQNPVMKSLATMGTASSNATSDEINPSSSGKHNSASSVAGSATGSATGAATSSGGGGGMASLLGGPGKEFLHPFGSLFTTRGDSQAFQWIIDESQAKATTVNLHVLWEFIEIVLGKLSYEEVQLLLVSLL